MNEYQEIFRILRSSPVMMAAIEASIHTALPNWCLTGGILRDIIWSEVLARKVRHRDIDLIYFDDKKTSPQFDWEIEATLERMSGLPFRVRNQARMHLFNSEEKYANVVDAMAKFPTTVSAIGVTATEDHLPVIFSIFGYKSLFEPCFEITPHFAENDRIDDFHAYLNRNNLLERWPEVSIRSRLNVSDTIRNSELTSDNYYKANAEPRYGHVKR